MTNSTKLCLIQMSVDATDQTVNQNTPTCFQTPLHSTRRKNEVFVKKAVKVKAMEKDTIMQLRTNILKEFSTVDFRTL